VVEPEHSYLVMEYVAGDTLERIPRSPISCPQQVVEIIFKCVARSSTFSSTA